MSREIHILKILGNTRHFKKGAWTMEITLEMIEEVLDATKKDYHTVKSALLETEGDVEAAIRLLAETPDEEGEVAKAAIEAEDTETMAEDEIRETDNTGTKAAEPEVGTEPEKGPEDKRLDDYADEIIERLKKKVQEGNVDRIKVSREGKTLLDIPLNLGLLGGILTIATIPWALILGVITAFGLNCKIEIITKDGNSEEM